MDTKFTKGPWRVYWMRPNIKGEPYQIIGAGGERITRWGAFIKPSQPTAVANAHLIAASPDLYEALVVCREAIVNQEGFGSAWPKIKAALAKARGEQL